MPRICSIVVLENHNGVRDLLAEALEAEGYRSTITHNGAGFRAALGSGKHDLALVDVSLRGEDGFALAEEAARAGLAVVLTTADRNQFEAVERGGRPYVLKPFQMRRLLDTVAAVLKERGADCVRRKRAQP